MLDIINILHEYWELFLIGQYPNGPLGGLANTLILASFSLIIAFPLSVLLAIARTSSLPIFRYPITVWIYFIRGIPLIMIIFWTYFLVPSIIGRNVSGFTTMLCTLVLYQSAYLCEILRGGLQSLPSGQIEASRALGLGYFRTLCWVLLPQALYNSIPSLISQFISIIKETSLGYVINVQEITFSANQVNNELLVKPFQVFFILAVTYFSLCFSLTKVAEWFERRVERKRQGDLELGN